MRKAALATSLLLSFYIYAQDNSDGQYTIGILPATSSATDAEKYLANIQSIVSGVFAEKTRFIVVDRTRFEQLSKERNLQKQEDFINGEVVEQGKSLGAQYLVSGSITQLSKTGGYLVKDKLASIAGKLANQKIDVYQVSVNITLNLQVIDVETGSIKSSKSLTEVTRTETTDEQLAISNAIKALEGNVRAWVNDVFPVVMKVIRVESTTKKGLPETLLIKGGSEMNLAKTKGPLFSSSSELEVYENEVMTIDGKEYTRSIPVGKVKISEVQGALSVCKVKSGAEAIQKKLNEGKTLLLRIISY